VVWEFIQRTAFYRELHSLFCGDSSGHADSEVLDNHLPSGQPAAGQ